MRLDDVGRALGRLLADGEQAHLGSGMPMTSRAKAWPITANWRRCSGRYSALAPTSRNAMGVGMHGMMVQIAGRCTPLMRRT